MSVRGVVGRLVGRLRPSHGDAAPAPRRDPEPVHTGFPSGRYVVAVESIPRLYAGRTASILAKARAFATRGVATEVLVVGYSGELDEVRAVIADRAALPAGSSIRSLLEWIEDDTPEARPPTVPGLDQAGLAHEAEPSDGVHRYYADGRLVRELVTDREGRVRVARSYDAEGVCRRVEDYDAGGRLRQVAEFVADDTKPRFAEYYRNNGSAAFRRVRRPSGDGQATIVETVEVLDTEGQVLETLDSWAAYVHRLLDRFAAGDRLFVTVEARVCDPFFLTWEYPLAKQVYVLHNPHILPPYDDPTRIRGGFKGLFRARNRVTTVFITHAQRDDAEARFGPTANWVVIPHYVRPVPAARAGSDGTSRRDPLKVVMMARLIEQKRIDRAIDAFAEVVRAVPGARLEIYGHGPLRDALAAQIERLGLGASVTLAGYTTDPDAVFAGASLSLLSSDYEALGLTLVESLMNGCPAVSVDVRYGPSDVIVPGRNGLLTPPGDTSALAGAIIALLRDPARREAMGEHGRAIREQFDQEVFVNRWAMVFTGLDSAGWG